MQFGVQKRWRIDGDDRRIFLFVSRGCGMHSTTFFSCEFSLPSPFFLIHSGLWSVFIRPPVTVLLQAKGTSKTLIEFSFICTPIGLKLWPEIISILFSAHNLVDKILYSIKLQ
jgi:hypothetical protein